MAMMAFERDIDTHAEAFGSTLTPRNRVTGATKEAPTIVRPVALDRGNVLRIKNGRGTRVHATDGVLWITEENSPDDHVLLPATPSISPKPVRRSCSPIVQRVSSSKCLLV